MNGFEPNKNYTAEELRLLRKDSEKQIFEKWANNLYGMLELLAKEDLNKSFTISYLTLSDETILSEWITTMEKQGYIVVQEPFEKLITLTWEEQNNN